ncbi:hypothetical protein ACFQ0Q_02745 [Streptomyces aureus]
MREGGRVIAVDVSHDGLAALAADLGEAVVPSPPTSPRPRPPTPSWPPRAVAWTPWRTSPA